MSNTQKKYPAIGYSYTIISSYAVIVQFQINSGPLPGLATYRRILYDDFDNQPGCSHRFYKFQEQLINTIIQGAI